MHVDAISFQCAVFWNFMTTHCRGGRFPTVAKSCGREIVGSSNSKANLLMDETRSVRRYTRRLALAAAICCGFPPANATEPSTLGGLLNQGWSTSQLPGQDGSQELRLPTVPSLVRPVPTPIDVPAVLTPAEIVKRASSEGADAPISQSRVLFPRFRSYLVHALPFV